MTVAHNQFSDWTDDEYKGLLGYKNIKKNDHQLISKPEPRVLSQMILDNNINWVKRGAVNPV